jgi:hypothetical protein
VKEIFDKALEAVRREMPRAGASPEQVDEAVEVLRAYSLVDRSTSSAPCLAAAAELALARRDGRDGVSAGLVARRYETHPPAVGRLAQTISDALVLSPPPIPIELARERGFSNAQAFRRMPRTRKEVYLRQSLAQWARDLMPVRPLHEQVRASSTTELATYLLRVALAWKPEVWRDLELRGNQTLYDLHSAIQDAFGWDRDHLWCFFMADVRGKFRPSRQADATYGEVDDAFSPDVELSKFGLRPRRRFRYLFDFGDNLLHEIAVRRVGKPEAGAKYPRVVGGEGEAPPQYEMEE